mgnify:CR=1 FL=1
MPELEIRLARSAAIPGVRCSAPGAFVAEALEASAIEALRMLSGRDSRLPPNIDAGARARTEAFVSSELRRRRFEELASVKIDASSVSTLFAVAELYVVGWI